MFSPRPPTVTDRLHPAPPARRWAANGGLVLCLGLVLALLVTPLLTGRTASVSAQTALPPPPAGWPSTLQLGMSDSPGGAAALQATAPFGFRYQYLAGGVNTGNGWATWNSDGHFVTYYIQDSAAHGITPVFTYYMIYQSLPGGGSESNAVATNLRTADTMRAYFGDLTLFFQRAGAFPDQTVVLHVEPDMWGYLQQGAAGDDAATYPVNVAATGLPELAGLPDNGAGLAQAVKRLRDRYAPNVRLAYHVSIWGTGVDIQYSQTGDAETDALAARAAAFYRSLGANFDLSFAEFSDRDAAFKQFIYGDGGRSWFDADDFRRHARFLRGFAQGANERVALWQIPLGNTRMRAQNNTWNHYQDNRVEWLLDDSTRAHLDEYVQAGIIAFLFGRGADGATCACDAAGDGVTNPDPINGNTATSLSADDDGGFFRERARAYYTTGALPLPGGSTAPTPTPPPTGTPTPPTATAVPTSTVPSFTTSTTVSPTTVAAGGSVTITTSVTSATAATALVDIEVYDPSGVKVFQQFYDNQAFAAGETKTYAVPWAVPATAATGTYTVKIGLFAPGWGTLYHWENAAAQFAVNAAAPSATATPPNTPIPTATAIPTSTPSPTPTPVDTTAPARPVVSSPAGAVSTRATTYTIAGTAEASALVRVWADANRNGAKDAGERLVGTQPLTNGATGFSIGVSLTAGTANEFVVTATDAAGNESPAADVPTITSTRKR